MQPETLSVMRGQFTAIFEEATPAVGATFQRDAATQPKHLGRCGIPTRAAWATTTSISSSASCRSRRARRRRRRRRRRRAVVSQLVPPVQVERRAAYHEEEAYEAYVSLHAPLARHAAHAPLADVHVRLHRLVVHARGEDFVSLAVQRGEDRVPGVHRVGRRGRRVVQGFRAVFAVGRFVEELRVGVGGRGAGEVRTGRGRSSFIRPGRANAPSVDPILREGRRGAGAREDAPGAPRGRLVSSCLARRWYRRRRRRVVARSTSLSRAGARNEWLGVTRARLLDSPRQLQQKNAATEC